MCPNFSQIETEKKKKKESERERQREAYARDKAVVVTGKKKTV